MSVIFCFQNHIYLFIQSFNCCFGANPICLSTTCPSFKRSNAGMFDIPFLIASSVFSSVSALKNFTSVSSCDNSSRSGFTIIEQNKIKFVKWSNYKTLEYANEYNTSMFRTSKNGKIVVFNRESDKTDNKIVVLGNNGKVKYEVQYKGIISDIALLGRHIYCISDTDVFVMDTDGKVLSRMQYGFGATRISVTGSNTVAIITDNKIEKQKLE